MHAVPIRLFILAGLFTLGWMHTAQDDISPDVCRDVRYMMVQNQTPYDFTTGGGALSPNSPINGSIPVDYYADFWSFDFEGSGASITLGFSGVGGAALEFALFNGMVIFDDYQPVQAQNYSYQLSRAGSYTVVVRRVNLSDQDSANYTLTLSGGQASDFAAPTTQGIQDINTNDPFSPRPQVNQGIVSLSVPSFDVRVHPEGILRANGNRGQVYFPSETFQNSTQGSFFLGEWVEQADFLGGDFAVTSAERTYYLEGYDFNTRRDGGSPAELELTDVTYEDGTRVQLDWNYLRGMWVTDECTGFKLSDGRTFTAVTPADERDVSVGAETSLEDFTVELNTLNIAGEIEPYSLQLSWNGIAPESEISLSGGVTNVLYVDNRNFAVQSNQLQLTSAPPVEARPGLLNAELADQEVSITLDWLNMQRFSLAGDQIDLTFLDEPRTSTARNGANLLRFEALEGIIQITYKDEGDTLGEQRLLLAEEDSYTELITPAGLPEFDGRALPDQPGYAPRALNNLGVECYPANTILPQANCPPNGHPNPANGN